MPIHKADEKDKNALVDSTTKTNQQYRILTKPCYTRRKFRLIYLALFVLRISCAILPGYIHPDEFFQGGQELFFGCSGLDGSKANTTFLNEEIFSTEWMSVLPVSTIPWEFESKNAIRSIVPPTLMTLLPLNIYAFFCNLYHSKNGLGDAKTCQTLTGFQIFILPRLFLALCSILTIDLPVLYLLRTKKQNSPQQFTNNGSSVGLLLLASSWPMLLFSNRTFTNTLETMILALLMALVHSDIIQCNRHHSDPAKNPPPSLIRNNVLVGILCSMGLFTRFTFLFFSFPTIIFLLYYRNRMETDMILRSLSYTFVSMFGGFAMMSAFFIHLDSEYYFQQEKSMIDITADPLHKKLVITPLNAFLYNSQVDNLSSHGLHLRITHSLINMPMLYGPLAIHFYWVMLKRIKSLLFSRLSSSLSGPFKIPIGYQKDHGDEIAIHMCQAVIVSGILVLSCAPHQEPRFLLPILIPLVVLHGQDIISIGGNSDNQETATIDNKSKKVSNISWSRSILWVGFNFLLFLFFGLLHQSGIVRSLLSMPNYDDNGQSETNTRAEATIYFKTYMPPTFLSRINIEGANYHDASTATKVQDTISEESGVDTNHNSNRHFHKSENMCKKMQCNIESSRPCQDKGNEVDFNGISTCATHILITNDQETCHQWPIIDLKGSSIHVLKYTLEKLLMCDKYERKIQDTNDTEPTSYARSKAFEVIETSSYSLKKYVDVVAPGVTIMRNKDRNPVDNSNKIPTSLSHNSFCDALGIKFKCHQKETHAWHLSTEDMPQWNGNFGEFFSNLNLKTFRVQCV